jgi:hypothetical protein
MIAALAALVLAAQPVPLTGVYQTQQMEVGATLELGKDGMFRYMLDYGAVSEAAEGHWTAADGVVHLDSDPLPTEVSRRIERSDASFRDEKLTVREDALVMRRHDTVFTFYRDKE